jgi:hypothetical protein
MYGTYYIISSNCFVTVDGFKMHYEKPALVVDKIAVMKEFLGIQA